MDVVVACGIQHAYFGKTGTRYLGEKADVLKVRIESFLKQEHGRGSLIFAAREVHQPDDPFYRQMKSHSVVGSQDIEIPEAFKPYIKLVVNTTRPSAWYATMMESEMHKAKPSKVFVLGVETHLAVLFTAEEFRNRGYEVIVPEALTASDDDYLHALGVNLLANSLSVVVS
jgi:nicotinamidase-related amidase